MSFSSIAAHKNDKTFFSEENPFGPGFHKSSFSKLSETRVRCRGTSDKAPPCSRYLVPKNRRPKSAAQSKPKGGVATDFQRPVVVFFLTGKRSEKLPHTANH